MTSAFQSMVPHKENIVKLDPRSPISGKGLGKGKKEQIHSCNATEFLTLPLANTVSGW